MPPETQPIKPADLSQTGGSDARSATAEEAATDPIVKATHRQLILGIRTSALIEIGLFFTVALLIDFFFLKGDRLQTVSPHPFWVVVVLMSVQYGTSHGLLAAGLATFFLLAGNIPKPAFGQDSFDFLLELTAHPLSWCMGGVLLGLIQDRQRKNRKTLWQSLDAADKREKAITTAYHRINKSKERLENQVAGQLKTVVSSFKAAKAIEQRNPAMVLSGARDMIRSVINPEAFSLFTLEEGELRLALQSGWGENQPYSDRYLNTDPLYQAVIGQKRFLVASQDSDREILGGDGVLAGPLINREGGNVTGMAKVERLGFMDFNITTVENFKALCEWVGASHDTAVGFQAAKKESVLNEEHQLFSFGFFPRQVALLTSLGRRLNFEVSLLVIRIDNYDDLPLEERKKIPSGISAATLAVMRNTDMAFDYEQPGQEFALLLPATPEKNMHFVLKKLDGALKKQLYSIVPNVKLSVSTQILYRAKENHPGGA